jgi:hypothetical protein
VDAGGEVGGCVIIDLCLWSRLARDLSSSTRLGGEVWGSFGNHLRVKLCQFGAQTHPYDILFFLFASLR